MEFKIGSVIEIESEENKKAIECMLERTETARTAFQLASVNVKIENKMLWELIEKLYPGIDAMHCTLKHETMEIVILGEK